MEAKKSVCDQGKRLRIWRAREFRNLCVRERIVRERAEVDERLAQVFRGSRIYAGRSSRGISEANQSKSEEKSVLSTSSGAE